MMPRDYLEVLIMRIALRSVASQAAGGESTQDHGNRLRRRKERQGMTGGGPTYF